MDRKLKSYRMLTQQILQSYAEIANRSHKNGIESFTAFDEKQDHYLLHTIGWRNVERIWNTTAYVRIRGNKLWIEIDWTERGIATDLLAAGVPKEDIILAFHHPSVRPYTEFEVA
jgi:hypothetical protein